MKTTDLLKIFIVILIAMSIPCLLHWMSLRNNQAPRTKHTSEVVTRVIEGNETRIETVKEVIKKEDKQILSLRDEIARLSDLVAQNEVDLDTVDLIASQRAKITKQEMLIGSLDFKIIKMDEIIQLQDQNIEVLKLDNKGLQFANQELTKQHRKMKRQRNFATFGMGVAVVLGTINTLIK